MSEDDARDWIEDRFGQAASGRLAAFLAMVVAENDRQNLIAGSTIESIWVRHALDSAQLVSLAKPGSWLDIGTGGGFPGMVAALLQHDPVTMVEPRQRRAAFLQRCLDELQVKTAVVMAARVETVTTAATNISARAVASIEKLLQIARHCATRDSRWLLPRGRIGSDEMAFLQANCAGLFHVERSLTSSDSSILVIEGMPKA